MPNSGVLTEVWDVKLMLSERLGMDPGGRRARVATTCPLQVFDRMSQGCISSYQLALIHCRWKHLCLECRIVSTFAGLLRAWQIRAETHCPEDGLLFALLCKPNACAGQITFVTKQGMVGGDLRSAFLRRGYSRL